MQGSSSHGCAKLYLRRLSQDLRMGNPLVVVATKSFSHILFIYWYLGGFSGTVPADLCTTSLRKTSTGINQRSENQGRVDLIVQPMLIALLLRHGQGAALTEALNLPGSPRPKTN
jgi:hypothetical protein